MRGVATALCITLILVSCFFAKGIYAQTVKKNMCAYTQQIKGDIQNGSDGIKDLKKYWKKNEKTLMALSNHKVCSDISQSISRLEIYLKYGSQADMHKYAELEILENYIDDITKPEQLKWYNVF